MILVLALGCAVPSAATASPTCTDGELLDDEGMCVPAACGASRWGSTAPEADAVYVDATSVGGDGSEAAPYASINEAFDAGASTIRVAAGVYPETLAYRHQFLTIVGRCAALVTLDASGGEDVGVMLTGQTEMTLAGITVRDATEYGLFVDGGMLTLHDVDVVGNAYAGIILGGGAHLTMEEGSIRDTQPFHFESATGLVVFDGANADLTGTTVADTPGIGILLSGEGSRLALHRVTVRDTTEVALDGDGVVVLDGGTLLVDGASVLTRNSGTNLSVVSEDSDALMTVTVTDTTLSDVQVASRVGGKMSASGMEVQGNADVAITSCTFADNVAGLVVADEGGYNPQVTITSSDFRGAAVWPDIGASDFISKDGIGVTGGAVVSDRGSRVTGGYSSGIAVMDGATLTLEDTVVEGIGRPDGTAALGVYAAGATLTASGVQISSIRRGDGEVAVGMLIYTEATAFVTDLAETDIWGEGLVVTDGAVAQIEGLSIQGVRASALSETDDLGIGVLVANADVTVTSGTLDDIDGIGVGVMGGTLTLSDVSVSNVQSIDEEIVGTAIAAESEDDVATLLIASSVDISSVQGAGVFVYGAASRAFLDDITISDGRYDDRLGGGNLAVGVIVENGAYASLSASEILDQPHVGLMVNGGSTDLDDTSVVDAVVDASDVTITNIYAESDDPAVGVLVQAHATFNGVRVRVTNSADVGLYAAIASLDCTACLVDGFDQAGAAVALGGQMALHATEVRGLGDVAFGVYGTGREAPSSLTFDEGSTVEAGGLAGVYLDGSGTWRLADCTIGGGIGGVLGGTTVQGNAVFGYQTTAWDEVSSTGLSISTCTLEDGAGPALLLEQGTASLCAVATPRTVWQGCPSAVEPAWCDESDLGEADACPTHPYAYVDPTSLGLYFVLPDETPTSLP